MATETFDAQHLRRLAKRRADLEAKLATVRDEIADLLVLGKEQANLSDTFLGELAGYPRSHVWTIIRDRKAAADGTEALDPA